MHGSLSKLSPDSASGFHATAAYYTRGVTMSTVEVDGDALAAMVGYYHDDADGARWFGGAVHHLGLTEGAPATAAQVRRLLQQLHPEDGSRLPNNGGRRASVSAMDFTLSVEKDYSTLWLLADESTRRQLEEILAHAAHEALRFMEENSAVVRVGEDGLAHRSASGFAAVEVGHSTARPVDGLAAPHLHRHLLIMNVAERDGVWTALDAQRLYEHQKVTAAIAGQIVRQRSSELLGISWVADESGVFRVAGFDSLLRQQLSLRQEQILEKAIETGLDTTDRDEWVAAQRISREGKSACGNDASAADWAISMLAEEGITYNSVIEKLHTATRLLHQPKEDLAWLLERLGPIPTDSGHLEQWRLDGAKALALGPGHLLSSVKQAVENGSSQVAPDWARLNAALMVPRTSLAEQRHELLLGVGRAKSTWRRRDLLIALADANVPLVEAETLADAFISSKAASYLYGIEDDPSSDIRVRWADQAIWATTETLEKERRLIEAARLGEGAADPLLTDEDFTRVVSAMEAGGKTLDTDSDQYRMLTAVLRGANTISLISGQAGAGKSTAIEALHLAATFGLMPEAQDAADSTHIYGVVGCTLTANAAQILSSRSGIEAHSIAMLLSQLDRGQARLAPGAVVVVDECSQTSTAQLFDLWQHVAAVGGRFVLIGDERQLQAVEAGGMYSTIIETVPGIAVFLDETRRQRDLEERAVLALIHDRGVLSARSREALTRQGVSETFLEELDEKGLGGAYEWYVAHERIVSHASVDEAVQAVARAYWDGIAAHGGDPTSTIITARTTPDIRLVDRAVVAEGVARGLLDEQNTVEFGRRELLVGQRIVARKVKRELDVLNGQVGTVRGIVERYSKFTVTLSSPSPFVRERVLTQAVTTGDTVPVRLSARQVQAERDQADKYLEKVTGQLAATHDRLATASDKSRDRLLQQIAKQESAVKEAQRWVAWAHDLDDAGQTVDLKVEKVREHELRPYLEVALDHDGATRYLPEEFVRRHVDSGYILTTQRAQGGDAQLAIEYNGFSYVGMSRGKSSNTAHITVPMRDPAEFEKMQKDQTPTIEWLREQAGVSETNVELASASHFLRGGENAHDLTFSPTPTISACVCASPRDALVTGAAAVAAEVAAGERAAILAKSAEDVASLNHWALSQYLNQKSDVVPVSIGERVWTRGMPVFVARGEVAGLEPDVMYEVATLSKHGMYVKVDEHTVQLTAAQVSEHLDQGFALTAARAQRSPELADRYIALSGGLADYDLQWLSSTAKPAELILVDPVVAAERAREADIRTAVLERIEKEARVDKQSRSATWQLDNSAPEIGLASLQAEIRLSAAEVHDVQSRPPREVALRDVQRDLTTVHKRIAELEVLSDSAELDEDRLDALSGLARTNEAKAELETRHDLLISDATDAEPSVAEELARSAERHAGAAKRLAEANRRLTTYTQARVTAALKTPLAYHQAISVGADLSPAEAVAARHAALLVVEEYRAKWGVVDLKEPLGPMPDKGPELEDWLKATSELAAIAGRQLTATELVR